MRGTGLFAYHMYSSQAGNKADVVPRDCLPPIAYAFYFNRTCPGAFIDRNRQLHVFAGDLLRLLQ